MRATGLTTVVFLLLLGVAPALAQSGGDPSAPDDSGYTLTWTVIGGGESSGDGYSFSGTIGPPGRRR
jgi:hypothetical protein